MQVSIWAADAKETATVCFSGSIFAIILDRNSRVWFHKNMGIEEFSKVRTMKKFGNGLMLVIFAFLYVIAFVIVHRSSTLRRPAYNMIYWYYNDHAALEAVEFYGFWPLRQITYRVFPGFMSRHIRERTWQTNVYPPGFAG